MGSPVERKVEKRSHVAGQKEPSNQPARAIGWRLTPIASRATVLRLTHRWPRAPPPPGDSLGSGSPRQTLRPESLETSSLVWSGTRDMFFKESDFFQVERRNYSLACTHSMGFFGQEQGAGQEGLGPSPTRPQVAILSTRTSTAPLQTGWGTKKYGYLVAKLNNHKRPRDSFLPQPDTGGSLVYFQTGEIHFPLP